MKEIEKFKNNKIKYNLVYRATKHGHFPEDFHNKCDGKNNTITIIKTEKGMKFGGYINYAWDSKSEWIIDYEDCFIFSLNHRKIYNPIKGKNKYFFYKGFGPNFAEFGTEDNLFQNTSLNVNDKRKANEYFSGFTSDYEINGGKQQFKAVEIEVLQISI